MVPQASDLDGEIELSTCYNVTEYQAQRNYGFQIHVRNLLAVENTTFFFLLVVMFDLVISPPDPGGSAHPVRHDGRHQEELDPGRHEERPSLHGPRRSKVGRNHCDLHWSVLLSLL